MKCDMWQVTCQDLETSFRFVRFKNEAVGSGRDWTNRKLTWTVSIPLRWNCSTQVGIWSSRTELPCATLQSWFAVRFITVSCSTSSEREDIWIGSGRRMVSISCPLWTQTKQVYLVQPLNYCNVFKHTSIFPSLTSATLSPSSTLALPFSLPPHSHDPSHSTLSLVTSSLSPLTPSSLSSLTILTFTPHTFHTHPCKAGGLDKVVGESLLFLLRKFFILSPTLFQMKKRVIGKSIIL